MNTLLSLVVVACAGDGRSSSDGETDDTGTSIEDSSVSSTDASNSMIEDETMGPGAETESSDPTMDESTTTGPTRCDGNEDCAAADRPFCVDGACVSCSGTPHPGNACAGFDPTTPLCVRDMCVQCTPESSAACSGVTPICDVNSNTCVACSFHEQCQALSLPACHIDEGSCFDAIAVTGVSTETPGSIQQAIDAVGDGEQHAIVLTGQQSSGQHISINGGKIIALVSSSDAIREVRGGIDEAPTVRVAGADTVAYLHRLSLRGNGDNVGIAVYSSAVLYADNAQIVQNSGGQVSAASGASAFLRNCFVGGNFEVDAINVNNASIDILYTSILAGLGDSTAIACSSPNAVDIRNSIVTTRGDNPAEMCAGATISDSAVEDDGITGWFADYNAGDAHLTVPAGATRFRDIAIWTPDDPPFDIDGGARPNTDGAMDYAGADVP